MRRFKVARAAPLGLVFALASLGLAAADPAPDTYAVGTPINVVLTLGVTTETAHVGDAFYFKTVDDVKLGSLDVPAGTPGTGRLAVSQAASSKTPGQMSLQADSLNLGSEVVWINIDPTVQPHGHYASNRDLVLDPGMKFRVTTIAPRKANAALVTPAPSETPATMSAAGPAPSSTP